MSSKLVYAMIQTNRSTLMRHLEKFRKDKTPLETIVAPRPLQGEFQTFYFGLMTLEENSLLHSHFVKTGKLLILDKVQYANEIAQIKFYWSA